MRTAIYVVNADPAYAVFDQALQSARLDEVENLQPRLLVVEHDGTIEHDGPEARDARLMLSGKPYSGCDIFHGEAGDDVTVLAKVG